VLAQGAATAEACRRIAISEQTYYLWRKEYSGLKTDQARRMKDLEKENARVSVVRKPPSISCRGI
jgi:transposase-like protein